MSEQLNFKSERFFDYRSQHTNHSGTVIKEYTHRLKIVADLTLHCICPVCGAPDCGNDMYLWAEFSGEKWAIHLGADSFDAYLNCWHYDGITEDEYRQLPELIRHSNEMIGWCDIYSEPNNEIDAFDFLKSLEVIKDSDYANDGGEFLEIYYPILKSFTNAVIKENTILNVLK
ncbi:hypothetical protein MUGA111182_02475 [Mucilaginibacter galii]|uniref:Uncharacterized protein n=1 Tax=Mucilaginibacter galii TaxID=2005073 RepID=A0A917J709_9SPHI|nr:hypothetical protein [Mucilaginibacter galii]GGI50258.1 hypothetical protein GCM10011425_14700 [Mucilaginibacter galii]